MKRLLAILLLTVTLSVRAAQIWTVNSVTDLQWLNASTINTNVYVVNGLAQGDGLGGMWSFFRGDVTATNTVANGGPVESVNPLSPPGRWFKLMGGVAMDSGGTNIFNTIIVTNILFANYIIVTNLYVTTNTFITINGDTNRAGLWSDFGTYIAPTSFTNQFQIDYDGRITTWTNGSAASPSYGWEGFGNGYGLFRDVNGEPSMSVSGTSVARFSAGGVQIPGGTGFGWRLGATESTPLLQRIYDNGDGWQYEYFGTNVLQVNSSGHIVFSPGTTNVLYRSGTDAHYTNGATQVFFKVLNGSGVAAGIGENSGGTPALSTSTGNFYLNSAYSSASTFEPNGTVSSGSNSSGGYWNGLFAKATSYFSGAGPGTTNYSRLALTHTGTPGVGAGITFESQAVNGGGNPRPFVFTNAPVQLPWFTSLQKTNLAEVANGMLIYQTDNTPGVRARIGGTWYILSTAADP